MNQYATSDSTYKYSYIYTGITPPKTPANFAQTAQLAIHLPLQHIFLYLSIIHQHTHSIYPPSIPNVTADMLIFINFIYSAL